MSVMRRSVASQLLSDVKVGCQLSGGIDSSLVTVFARSQLGAGMDTFSVVFEDPKFSEDRWISEAAAAATAESHRFMFSEASFTGPLQRASWHMDQPISHPNSLGLWLLAEQARERVTVLLSGEGADEVFGGYTRFASAHCRHSQAARSRHSSGPRNSSRRRSWRGCGPPPTWRRPSRGARRCFTKAAATTCRTA